MAKTKNFGQISAIYINTTAPNNIKLLWYDNNVGVKQVKFYDTLIGQWVQLSNGGVSSPYRQGVEIIFANSINMVNFSFGATPTPFPDNNWIFCRLFRLMAIWRGAYKFIPRSGIKDK